MRANMSTSSKGATMYNDVKNGIYDRMSFSFTVAKEYFDKVTRTRVIQEIKRLFDVSVVTFPAYNQTSVLARSFSEAEAEKERIEIRQREDKKKRLALKLKIEGGLE